MLDAFHAIDGRRLHLYYMEADASDTHDRQHSSEADTV